MKLSKKQLEVIALMKEGNTINVGWGLASNVAVKRKSQIIKHISYPTFNALLKAKIIYFTITKDRENIYALTPEGLAIDTSEQPSEK